MKRLAAVSLAQLQHATLTETSTISHTIANHSRSCAGSVHPIIAAVTQQSSSYHSHSSPGSVVQCNHLSLPGRFGLTRPFHMHAAKPPLPSRGFGVSNAIMSRSARPLCTARNTPARLPEAAEALRGMTRSHARCSSGISGISGINVPASQLRGYASQPIGRITPEGFTERAWEVCLVEND